MTRIHPAMSLIGEPYWKAAGEGRLIVQRCDSCGNLQLYPGYACKNCRAVELGWQEVSGNGLIYSYTVQYRGVAGRAEAGLIIGIVELVEGPRLMSNIVGADPEDVYIGAHVNVDFLTEDGFTLPVFRLSQGSASARR
jgi:uncharacterized protein